MSWLILSRWTEDDDRSVSTAAAWHDWWVASCEEFNDGHPWEMFLDYDGSVSVCCAACPADMNVAYPDGIELLYAEFPWQGRQVKVEYGMHELDIPEPETWRVPIGLDIETVHHRGGPWGPDEWDVLITAVPDNGRVRRPLAR